MTPTVDIIEDYLKQIDRQQLISKVTVSGTAYTLITVPYLYYMRVGMAIDINGTSYTIAAIQSGQIRINTVTVALTASKGTYLTMPQLVYFHGTPIAVNNELSALKVSTDKTPMLYLMERFSELSDNDPESAIDRTPDLRLFFLDDYNPKDWTTDDHYSEIIDGLFEFAKLKFLDEMANYPGFGLVRDIDWTMQVKFGVYLDNKGSENSVFNEYLSGVELRVSVPILKDLGC